MSFFSRFMMAAVCTTCFCLFSRDNKWVDQIRLNFAQTWLIYPGSSNIGLMLFGFFHRFIRWPLYDVISTEF